jgi:hypothetical protein
MIRTVSDRESKLVFVAVPTSGVAANGRLNESFIRDIALLHELFPTITFIVPMIQDYALLPHMSVDATWEKWGHHCRKLIERCDEVWVLKYKGYDTSVGVAGEVRHAGLHGVLVRWFGIPMAETL